MVEHSRNLIGCIDQSDSLTRSQLVSLTLSLAEQAPILERGDDERASRYRGDRKIKIPISQGRCRTDVARSRSGGVQSLKEN